MDQEKSAIQELKDFAKKTGRSVEVSEKDYPVDKLRPRYLSRNYIVISSQFNSSVKFVSFNDDKAFGDNSMYCGVFFPINAPKSSIINIRKKNILDKLNPLLKQKDYGGMSDGFISKVVIVDEDSHSTNKIFNNYRLQDHTIAALNLDERLRVGINTIEIDMVPEFKNKSLFGIYMSPQWLLNDVLIEKLFGLGEDIFSRNLV